MRQLGSYLNLIARYPSGESDHGGEDRQADKDLERSQHPTIYDTHQSDYAQSLEPDENPQDSRCPPADTPRHSRENNNYHNALHAPRSGGPF